MAAIRRLVIALAVLAVFAGLASAQDIFPLACSVTLNTPSVRSEGKTEQVGDILLNCINGNPLYDGVPSPRANFKVQIGGSSAITSRVTSGTSTPILTDALLTIDEPGLTASNPVLSGFGSDQLPTACTTLNSSGGCTDPAFKQTLPSGTIVMSTVSTPPTPGAPNVFQGVLGADGTSVTFMNVPVLPTGLSNSVRVFRITNIRVDATGGQASITAGVTVISNPPVVINGPNSGSVAAVMGGLSTDTTKVTFVGSAPVCIGKDMSYVAAISFGEKFSTAFKTRLAGTAASGSVFTAMQNIPGPYLGESGYTPFGTATGRIGVADFGTRLKATFSNIPAGVRVFVSATNMVNTTAANAGTAVGNLIDGAAASNVPTSFAVLIGTTDTTPDSFTGPPLATTGTGPVELTVSTTGAATAVWEVVNTNPAATERLTFAVYLTYAANVPLVTSITSSLSYGPTFTGSTSRPPIPNFVNADLIKGKVFDLLSGCRTDLLFPYVTNNAVFETGIAIANTTADSPLFRDVPQSGTCTLYLYPAPPGPMGPITSIDFGTVAAGTVKGETISGLLNAAGAVGSFTGYIIASCNFQLAHGFVFIANWGDPATSSAMGYLALVVPDVDIVSRTAASPRGEGLDQ